MQVFNHISSAFLKSLTDGSLLNSIKHKVNKISIVMTAKWGDVSKINNPAKDTKGVLPALSTAVLNLKQMFYERMSVVCFLK